ncbi:MAG TPA: hypothetical protein PLO40_13120 [Spirochaetota bacterium]|nr:hypothetical protein [Spirochaetota bacterium]HQH31712.1 hypothetical protein [Spirochaetota bacterium]
MASFDMITEDLSSQVPDKEARNWYAKEALNETWSSRTLRAEIETQKTLFYLQQREKESEK